MANNTFATTTPVFAGSNLGLLAFKTNSLDYDILEGWPGLHGLYLEGAPQIPAMEVIIPYRATRVLRAADI